MNLGQSIIPKRADLSHKPLVNSPNLTGFIPVLKHGDRIFCPALEERDPAIFGIRVSFPRLEMSWLLLGNISSIFVYCGLVVKI